MNGSEKIGLSVELRLILFFFSLVLFLWPFLCREIRLDLRTLFLHLFISWAVVITIIFFVSRRLARAYPEARSDDKGVS